MPSKQPQPRPNKVLITLRIDPDVIAHFRQTGRGWQTRINEALKRVVRINASKT